MGENSIGMLRYLFVGIITVLLTVMFILLREKKKKRAEDDFFQTKKTVSSRNYLAFVNRIYQAVPFLRMYQKKVRAKVALMYPADAYSINKKTAAILAKGTVGGIIGVLFTTICSKGNIFYLCAGYLMSYVVITEIVTNSVNKMEEEIQKQFRLALQKVRHYYHEYKDVPMALQMSIDVLPFEISLHMQNIYDIVTSPDTKYESDKYVDSCPDKMMLTFLAICSSVKEMGDKELEDGKSLFLSDLEQLSADISDELLIGKKNRIAFSALTWISILPIILVKPAEQAVISMMPETKTLYEGIYGIVAMIAIFVLSFIAHALVIALRDKNREVEKDDDVFAKAAEHEMLSDFLSRMINKNFNKYNAYNNALKGIGDHTGPKAFLLKRLVFAVAAFGVTIFILMGSGVTQKLSLLNNFEEDFLNSVVPNEEYRTQMRLVAEDYTKTYAHDYVQPEDLTKQIMQEYGLKQVYAETVAKVVDEHVLNYKNTYFKWYYLVIAVFLGACGYITPVAMLKFKKTTIELRQQEEVMQFQSLMLILMYMDGMNLDEILEWLERFSYCFREEIATCRLNLNGGHREALEDMKALVMYEPFESFIDNLIAIDDVGVVDAFDEVKQEREYSRKNKVIEMEESIVKKSNRAKIVSYVPPTAVMILYLLVPMAVYALNMYAQFKAVM